MFTVPCLAGPRRTNLSSRCARALCHSPSHLYGPWSSLSCGRSPTSFVLPAQPTRAQSQSPDSLQPHRIAFHRCADHCSQFRAATTAIQRWPELLCEPPLHHLIPKAHFLAGSLSQPHQPPYLPSLAPSRPRSPPSSAPSPAATATATATAHSNTRALCAALFASPHCSSPCLRGPTAAHEAATNTRQRKELPPFTTPRCIHRASNSVPLLHYERRAKSGSCRRRV